MDLFDPKRPFATHVPHLAVRDHESFLPLILDTDILIRII